MKRISRYASLLLAASLVSSSFAVRAEEPARSSGAGTAAQAGPGVADPAKMDEARERYNRGLRLFEQGNVVAARIEFERAYELAPSYRILYNIGLCYQVSNDYVGALRSFERYLAEGRDEIAEERRAAVTREMQNLKPNIASLTLSSREAGVAVSIDDVPVGQTPLPDKVLLNAGNRKVTATKNGFFPQTKSIVLAGSDNASLQVDLVALPAPGQQQKEGPGAAPYVAWGLTGALAIGAGVTGYLALKANSDQNHLVDRPGATRSEVDDAHSKTRTFSIAADCLAAATVLAGGLAIYLSVRKADKPSSIETTARVTPGGVSLVGRF